MGSLKKNYFYNIFYRLLLIFIPFFTVPYISRVLGSNNVGAYSFTYSIVSYFMVLAMLGVSNYGVREIAKCQDNKKAISKTFFSIYALQFISSLIMLVLYSLYVIFLSGEYQSLALAQTICLVSVFFDFSWFFFGKEEFKLVVIGNGLIKLSSLVAIFIFIKDDSDLLIYTLIVALGTLLSHLVLLPSLKKQIYLIKPSFIDIKKHIKPCLMLFIPVISVSLYNIMDKTMLGIMTNMDEVGYYSQAEKLIQVPITLITALSAVMMPRISNLVAKSNSRKIMDYLGRAVFFMSYLTIPVSLGLIIIAPTFVPIFLGPGYNKSSLILALLSVVIVFKSLGSILRSQYMTPHNMDREYAIVTIMGAIINLGLNAILIPHIQSIGACIGTIVTEFAVLVYMSFILRKKLPILQYIKTISRNLWKGTVMFILVFILRLILRTDDILKIIIEVSAGVVIYAILSHKTLIQILGREKNEETGR